MDPVDLKKDQKELSLKAFFRDHLFDLDNRNVEHKPNMEEDMDFDSLRYRYMMVGQYPALGEWHFLVKRYVLQGIGEDSGFRDIFPPKEKITDSLHVERTRQGTAKVVYMSLEFVKAWIKHLLTELPPMTGEKWSKDKDNNPKIQWFYKEGDLRT